MTDGSTKIVSDWCKSFIDALRPQSILIAGDGVEEMTGCFVEKGVSAAAISWTDFAREKLPLSRAWDVLILNFGSANIPLDLPEKAFGEHQGAPRAILALIPLVEDGPSLPDVSEWLRRFGYTRDFGEEGWSDQRSFTAIYRKSLAATDQLLWQHEAECWRLAQMNQKRRLLLSEYMAEIIETTFRYDSQAAQLNLLNQNLMKELERQTEYSKSLQEELKRQEDWASKLQHELKQQEEWTVRLQQELKQQEEWASKLQHELKQQEEWAKILQNEVAQRTNAYNGLLEENRALQQIKAQWEGFQASRFGKLWKQFHQSGR